MTHNEFVAKVADETELPRRLVSLVLSYVIQVATQEVMSGSRVRLRGFGTFYMMTPKKKRVFGKRFTTRPTIKFKESRHGHARLSAAKVLPDSER